MKISAFHYRNWAVGTKLISLTLLLVGTLLFAAIQLIGYATSSILEQRLTVQISDETRSVINMVDMFDRSVSSLVERFSSMIVNAFPENFRSMPAEPCKSATKPPPFCATATPI